MKKLLLSLILMLSTQLAWNMQIPKRQYSCCACNDTPKEIQKFELMTVHDSKKHSFYLCETHGIELNTPDGQIPETSITYKNGNVYITSGPMQSSFSLIKNPRIHNPVATPQNRTLTPIPTPDHTFRNVATAEENLRNILAEEPYIDLNDNAQAPSNHASQWKPSAKQSLMALAAGVAVGGILYIVKRYKERTKIEQEDDTKNEIPV